MTHRSTMALVSVLTACVPSGTSVPVPALDASELSFLVLAREGVVEKIEGPLEPEALDGKALSLSTGGSVAVLTFSDRALIEAHPSVDLGRKREVELSLAPTDSCADGRFVAEGARVVGLSVPSSKTLLVVAGDPIPDTALEELSLSVPVSLTGCEIPGLGSTVVAFGAEPAYLPSPAIVEGIEETYEPADAGHSSIHFFEDVDVIDADHLLVMSQTHAHFVERGRLYDDTMPSLRILSTNAVDPGVEGDFLFKSASIRKPSSVNEAFVVAILNGADVLDRAVSAVQQLAVSPSGLSSVRTSTVIFRGNMRQVLFAPDEDSVLILGEIKPEEGEPIGAVLYGSLDGPFKMTTYEYSFTHGVFVGSTLILGAESGYTLEGVIDEDAPDLGFGDFVETQVGVSDVRGLDAGPDGRVWALLKGQGLFLRGGPGRWTRQRMRFPFALRQSCLDLGLDQCASNDTPGDFDGFAIDEEGLLFILPHKCPGVLVYDPNRACMGMADASDIVDTSVGEDLEAVALQDGAVFVSGIPGLVVQVPR